MIGLGSDKKKTTKSDAWMLRDTDHRIHEGFNLFSITPKTITEEI